MHIKNPFRRFSLSEDKKDEKKKKKDEEKKAKEEKRKSRTNPPAGTMDPDHPPGARDVGFRKSFAIAGDAKNGGGESGRNSPTAMANTAANATVNAMNNQPRSGDNLEVPKTGQGKMQTLDKYGSAYEAVSPRTHTEDSSAPRKISEDLDLTKSPSPPSAKPELNPITETNHYNNNAAKEEEAGGTLEPTTTRIDASLDPNLSTVSDPSQQHIIPVQNIDFLSTNPNRPGAPLEKRNTHTSSIYSDSFNNLTPMTTNRSDVNVPLEKTTTNDSHYTQEESGDDDIDLTKLPKPRPTTLQQEYTTLVDLPITPLPSNTNFSENDIAPAKIDDVTTPAEEKDELDVVTPKARQQEFGEAQGPALYDAEVVKDDGAPSKPGDFVAAIQNTFPTSGPNTAPVPVSPKDFASETKDSTEELRETSASDLTGAQITKGDHHQAVDKSSTPSHPSNDEKKEPTVAPLDSEKAAEATYLKLTQTPPLQETNSETRPQAHEPLAKGPLEKLKLEEQPPVAIDADPHTEIPLKAVSQRPGLVERDTADLIRQTPGGFLPDTPAEEKVPDVAAN